MSKKNGEETILQVIRTRRQSLHIRKGYISLLFRIIFLTLITYVLLTEVFLVTQARGNHMFPAIKDGDLVIAFRIQKEYAKNDAVVYQVEGKSYIGRILAKENDVVTLDDSGTLLVNGTVQRGDIVFPTYAREGLKYPLKIESQKFFLLGDNRMQTWDSRDFGPIPEEAVLGKIITILRRRGL